MRPPRATDVFRVTRSDGQGTVVLALSGELDVAGVDRFAAAAVDIPPGMRAMVDLSDLEFIDSSGLRMLMNLDLRSRAEGWSLELREPRPAVKRLLQICGFEGRVAIGGSDPPAEARRG